MCYQSWQHIGFFQNAQGFGKSRFGRLPFVFQQTPSVKFRLFAELERRDLILLFKRRLKMTLAGETEVITDHAERFVGELQQMFSLFQFTAQDKCAECEAKLFFEIGRKIRTAETDMIRDLGGSDRAVDVLKN